MGHLTRKSYLSHKKARTRARLSSCTIRHKHHAAETYVLIVFPSQNIWAHNTTLWAIPAGNKRYGMQGKDNTALALALIMAKP